MSNQVLSDSAVQDIQLDLIKVMTDIDFVTMKMLEVVEECEILTDQHVFNSSCVVPLPPQPNAISTDIVVGFDEVMDGMLNRLIGQATSRQLQVIPVVGMGGIGKTTLAQKLYNHPGIKTKFDRRAWVTVSREFNPRVALLALLNCLVKNTEEMRKADGHEVLGEYVHKSLFRHRYLIIVDDIWNIEAWEKMKIYFPNNINGSRVLLTTRDSTIARLARSSDYTLELPLINSSKSWELLSRKVFGRYSCPPELVETGRKIASKCGGLPLTVLAMAGFLSMSKKTLRIWELVAKNVSSTIAHVDLHFKTLLMSYSHLPYYMKPCFLYVGAYPEDYEIQSSKIIKLWIAEGFIKPVGDNNLEDTAEAILMALIDANLLQVCRKKPNGKVMSFKIHDLLREICQRKSIEERFLWFRRFNDCNIEEGDIIRRVSAHPLSHQLNSSGLSSVARSFLCIGLASVQPAPTFLDLQLLRVLDVFQLQFTNFPTEILKLVNLKHLAISCHSDLPSSVSRFRNLQTLIIRRISSVRAFTLPSELWEMTQLKHIKSKGTCTWHYLRTGENVIHEKLQTLSNVHISGASNTLFEKIPNLSKLGIFCEASLDTSIDVSCLRKLEILKCSSNLSMGMTSFLSHLILPASLKKISLCTCNIPCEFMGTIGSLPNLEQLKLQTNDFLVIPTESDPEPRGPTWELTEGEFAKLRFLLMEELNLVRWEADETHFPVLQHLVIRNCCDLTVVSCDFGESNTLILIEVDKSSTPLLNSVLDVQRQKEAFGIALQVIVHEPY